jgi:hypothetical protein
MNKYRQIMISERETNVETEKICTRCAGWSSFGNKHTPLYIALHGEICCCKDFWLILTSKLSKYKKKMLTP